MRSLYQQSLLRIKKKKKKKKKKTNIVLPQYQQTTDFFFFFFFLMFHFVRIAWNSDTKTLLYSSRKLDIKCFNIFCAESLKDINAFFKFKHSWWNTDSSKQFAVGYPL